MRQISDKYPRRLVDDFLDFLDAMVLAVIGTIGLANSFVSDRLGLLMQVVSISIKYLTSRVLVGCGLFLSFMLA